MKVYPEPNFDSYVSLADAETIAAGYVSYEAWAKLTDQKKEQYLLTSFRLIQGLIGYVGPDDSIPQDSGCLPRAQVEVALNDIRYGISASKGDAKIASLSAGPTSISYFEGAEAIASSIPDESYGCLALWGAILDSSSDGPIGSMRMTR